MKRIIALLLLTILLIPVAASQAQDSATTLELVTIDLWPDYDRAAVLVLIKGSLPETTALPATITLPLPETADFNVVARIDAADGQMKDDVEFTKNPASVTFTTPDRRFQMEYYLPYNDTNLNRTINFTWLSDVNVTEMQLNVQQPTAASTMSTDPVAVDVTTGQDGFTYHLLPLRGVAAGQTYFVSVEYTMSSSQLSVSPSGPSIVDAQTTGFTETGSTVDWPVIIGGVGLVLIVLALTWQVASTRASARPRKPSPVREAKETSSAGFCHSCGEPLRSSDKFCRECGTPAKNK